MDGLIELKVLGVTRSQLQAGAYALLLEEKDGTRRVPIVVGIAEAQSIAVRLEGVIPPRPLTHDLMTSVFHAYGITLESVTIVGFEKGVFTSVLKLKGDSGEVELDSRTSDAIALALRTGANIFVTPEVMEHASYDPAGEKKNSDSGAVRLEDMSEERLKARMQHHVECEEYEQAAQIQKILESRVKSR